MKTMTVTDFKARALRVLGEMPKNREAILLTKRGKPVAKIVPVSDEKPVPGKLAKTLVFEKDIVSPLGEEMWDACK